MNNQNKAHFGDNINYGQHIGNNIQQNIYTSTDTLEKKRDVDEYLPESLFEKKPSMNVLVRFALAVLAAGVDFFAIDKAVETQTLNNLGVIAFAVLLGLFAYFLFLSTIDLVVYGRCGRLRRIGINVFDVKTCECPICAKKNYEGKLRLIHESGSNRYGVGADYLVCSNDSKEHRWYVTFPKEKR